MSVLTKLINVTVIILSLTLGFFFMFIGILKLTPALNEDTHEELRKQFVRMAKVFPLANVLEFRVDADVYRVAVGVVELVCGAVLALIPGCMRDVANMVLVVMMAGAAYSHYALNDSFEKMIPAIVCGALLTLRLVTRKLMCSCDMSCQRKSATTEAHSKAE